MKTAITWDAQQMTGMVEGTVQIDGLGKRTEDTVEKGIYLTSPDAYTEPVLTACIIDREGKEMDRIFPLPLEKEMQFCMRVEEPQLWNAEEPYCYQLVLEIVEGENFCQDRRVEPIAFSNWMIVNGQTCINGKLVSFRAVSLPEQIKDETALQNFLRTMKQKFQNTLLVKSGEKSAQLKRWCLEYGIYLLEVGKDIDAGWLRARLDMEKEKKENPDFQLQVVQTGVLIENKSTFADASQYYLRCEILDAAGKVVWAEKLCTDVPAGSSKYVDIPFERPSEPGEYLYRAALCLKEDVPWAPKGYAIASAETKISNLYEGLEMS